MAVWLSGGAGRIVLRIEVQQKITDEGHQFIKDQMSRTISDGEIIHWSAQSTGEIEMLLNQLKSYGYKGPEHLDDADIFLGGPYPTYHPKWLQFLTIIVNENSKYAWNKFPAVTLRASKIMTVLDPNRNIHHLNKVFSIEKEDMNSEYYKERNEGYLDQLAKIKKQLKAENDPQIKSLKPLVTDLGKDILENKNSEISHLSEEQKIVLRNIINNPQHSWMVEYTKIMGEKFSNYLASDVDKGKVTFDNFLENQKNDQ